MRDKKSNIDNDDPRDCVCFLLSRAAQAAQKKLRTMLEPYSLTPAQYLILESLWVKDGLAPKTLGDLLKFDSATLTGLIDRLERDGLVKREPDPEDRRAIRIVLEKKGKKLKGELRQLRHKANEEILKSFSRKKRDRLKNTLLEVISTDEPISNLKF